MRMCLSPRKLSNGRNVRCGKCLECVSQYQDQWMIRMAEESLDWKYCFFLTLTYDPEHLPTIPFGVALSLLRKANGPFVYSHSSFLDALAHNLVKGDQYWKDRKDMRPMFDYLRLDQFDPDDDRICTVEIPYVNYSDIRSWFKVVRQSFYRDFGSWPRFKYFLCSEYGPQTSRPHYHIFIMCDDWIFPDGRDFIKDYFIKYWRFGSVKCGSSKEPGLHPLRGTRGLQGDITAVTKYVSKYCCKPAMVQSPFLLLGIPSEFRLCSNGVGASFRQNYVNQVKSVVNRYEQQGNFYTDAPGNFYGVNSQALQEIHNLSFATFTVKSGDLLSYRLPRYCLDHLNPRRYSNVTVVDQTTGEISRVRKSFVLFDELSSYVKAYSSAVASFNNLQQQYQRARDSSFFGDFLDVTDSDLARASLSIIAERRSKKIRSFKKYYRDKGYLSPY